MAKVGRPKTGKKKTPISLSFSKGFLVQLEEIGVNDKGAYFETLGYQDMARKANCSVQDRADMAYLFELKCEIESLHKELIHLEANIKTKTDVFNTMKTGLIDRGLLNGGNGNGVKEEKAINIG